MGADTNGNGLRSEPFPSPPQQLQQHGPDDDPSQPPEPHLETEGQRLDGDDQGPERNAQGREKEGSCPEGSSSVLEKGGTALEKEGSCPEGDSQGLGTDSQGAEREGPSTDPCVSPRRSLTPSPEETVPRPKLPHSLLAAQPLVQVS